MNALKKADPIELRRIVDHLALKIGPRHYSATHSLDKTRDFIIKEFELQGRKIWLQDFQYRGNIYWNVIASNHNGISQHIDKEPILVIGAHYDTVSTTPGADDNASGIAGLIELSRILGKHLPDDVVLAAFSLEEPPCYRTRNMGSYHLAKHLKKSDIDLKGMVCLEMIGYYSDSPNSQSFPVPFMKGIYSNIGNFIGLVGNLWSKGLTKRLKASFLKAGTIPTESINAPFWVIGSDFSDHWAFYKFGYRAVMVTDTAFYRNPNYHRPTDLPQTLDFHRMAAVVDALVVATIDLCRLSL
ncbi:hypothetical protein DBT_1185 [Dissulfuribacter thermophilus]|uniref:Peptidase M28 domain-containing protein n=1 Tax=Dissulfuribacter thermophilus TaxID=1156395 RepID=A0A1B9F660_9BACT|nr:M28 family peptidase [Dissulfuribacter thermophilus]OCC15438.1 hypothetical protein DBT_1185 [Dissulfuribacter thermophilus]